MLALNDKWVHDWYLCEILVLHSHVYIYYYFSFNSCLYFCPFCMYHLLLMFNLCPWWMMLVCQFWSSLSIMTEWFESDRFLFVSSYLSLSHVEEEKRRHHLLCWCVTIAKKKAKWNGKNKKKYDMGKGVLHSEIKRNSPTIWGSSFQCCIWLWNSFWRYGHRVLMMPMVPAQC